MERDRKREGGGWERIWPDHREDTRSLFWTSQGHGWTLCAHRCLLFSIGPTRLSVKTAKRHPEKAQRLMTLNHWKIQWVQVGLCKWYWWILSRSWISDSIKNLQSKMGMVKREGKRWMVLRRIWMQYQPSEAPEESSSEHNFKKSYRWAHRIVWNIQVATWNANFTVFSLNYRIKMLNWLTGSQKTMELCDANKLRTIRVSLSSCTKLNSQAHWTYPCQLRNWRTIKIYELGNPSRAS